MTENTTNANTVTTISSGVASEGRKIVKGRQVANNRQTSFFEFWPTWVMYLPVALLWLILAVRYRSLTLPLIANPGMVMGGMVGGSKHDLMSKAGKYCREAILPWVCYSVTTDSADEQAAKLIAVSADANIKLPFVCKPDMGCRGAGVKLVSTPKQLAEIIVDYPPGALLLCQKLSEFEPEVGIFYVRYPWNIQGQIVSLTEKITPSVVGDGKKTLSELVVLDARAASLLPLYQTRNLYAWNTVIPEGERYRLLFSASHCRGAVFQDKSTHITQSLSSHIDTLMRDIPGFYYGRLDVKYRDSESLAQGENLHIIEINGASSESIQIWDKNAKFWTAIKTLMWQYYTLFKMGNYNRDRGEKTPGIVALIKAWRTQRELVRHYPTTD